MGFTETLRLLVEADTKGAVASVEKLGSASEKAASRSEKALDRWGNRMQSVGTGMMLFGGVALAGLKQAGDAASDLNEVASKSSTVFGSAADEVDKFASNAADIGLSKTAALEAASGFGNLFDQLGFANDASADMSISLSKLAADFASFHNADITEVIEAQTAAFRGEYDSLQRFVPTINAAAVQQQAMAETGKDNADALTDAEKAAATYTLMIEGAGAAQGDFARTSDSAANKQRQLSANFENLKAGIGAGVLPVMSMFLDVTNKAVGGLSGLNAVTDGTLGKVATFGAVGLVAAGGVSTLVGKVISMRDNLKTGWDAVSGMTGKLNEMKGALALGAGAVGILATGFVLWQQQNAEAQAELDELREALRETKGEIDGVTEALVVDAFRPWMDDMAEAGVKMSDLEAALNGNEGALRRIQGAMSDMSFNEARQFMDQFEAMKKGLSDQRQALEDEAAVTDDAAESHGFFAKGVELATSALHESSDATADAEDALKEYQDTLNGTFDPITKMSDALDDNAEAQETLHTRQLELIGAQDAYNDAVDKHGESSKAARDASVELMEAQDNLADAERGARDSVIDLSGAAADLQFEMEQNGLTAEAARERFINMAVQMGYTRAEAGRLASGFGFATTEAQRLGQQHPRPTVGARDFATGIINSVSSRLGTLNGDSATVTLNANLILNKVKGFFGFAGGGVVPQYLASGGFSGSRGTDTVPAYLTPGEMVLNKGQQAQLWQIANGAGRGGGNTIIHVHGSVLSERELYRLINKGRRDGDLN